MQLQFSFALYSSLVAAAAVFPLDTRFTPAILERQAVTNCPNFPPTPAALNAAFQVRNTKLPNPFKFLDGRSVTTKEQWECRRQEIAYLLQHFELGFKPGKPTSVSATLTSWPANDDIAITVTDQGKTVSFTVQLAKRPSATAAPTALPVMIALASNFVPTDPNVVKITIPSPEDRIAKKSGFGTGNPRGQGPFFDLYGQNGVGILTAWAWAVSRIIDVLEVYGAGWGLDSTRVGVTGCSRWGKGALVAAALDERISLAVPSESGTGGSACWRISDWENSTANSYYKNGNNLTQAAYEIVDTAVEDIWFAANFTTNVARGTAGKDVNYLPFDHHMLQGLVAPRGLLSIDAAKTTSWYFGQQKEAWLAPISCRGCSTAARDIYKALGVQDNIGSSMAAGHDHCSFPDYQQPDLNAFVGKFLLKNGSSTAGIWRNTWNVPDNKALWVDWTAPLLT